MTILMYTFKEFDCHQTLPYKTYIFYKLPLNGTYCTAEPNNFNWKTLFIYSLELLISYWDMGSASYRFMQDQNTIETSR